MGQNFFLSSRSENQRQYHTAFFCLEKETSDSSNVRLNMDCSETHEKKKHNMFGCVFHAINVLCLTSCLSFVFHPQGVYRISGAKPRILKLCQAFEIQKDNVDLSEHSPHDISSVLKHFFKEVAGHHNKCLTDSLPNYGCKTHMHLLILLITHFGSFHSCLSHC